MILRAVDPITKRAFLNEPVIIIIMHLINSNCCFQAFWPRTNWLEFSPTWTNWSVLIQSFLVNCKMPLTLPRSRVMRWGAEELSHSDKILTNETIFRQDFTTVNIGKLFMESAAMLHSFETYCLRQGSASLLLNQQEKENELLRVFLRVSQMENALLRRMNLSAFLMVPVQRVTK